MREHLVLFPSLASAGRFSDLPGAMEPVCQAPTLHCSEAVITQEVRIGPSTILERHFNNKGLHFRDTMVWMD